MALVTVTTTDFKQEDKWIQKENIKQVKMVKNLLSKNVLITDKMLHSLKDSEIIDGIFHDELELENEEERFQIIFSLLENKPVSQILKFCDILILHGHPIFSDFLLRIVFPIDSSSQSQLNLDSVWLAVPSLKSQLPVSDIHVLEETLNEKFMEKEFTKTLAERYQLSSDLLIQKKKYAEESWKYLKLAKENGTKVKQISNELSKTQKEYDLLQYKLNDFKDIIKVKEDKLRESLDRQRGLEEKATALAVQLKQAEETNEQLVEQINNYEQVFITIQTQISGLDLSNENKEEVNKNVETAASVMQQMQQIRKEFENFKSVQKEYDTLNQAVVGTIQQMPNNSATTFTGNAYSAETLSELLQSNIQEIILENQSLNMQGNQDVKEDVAELRNKVTVLEKMVHRYEDQGYPRRKSSLSSLPNESAPRSSPTTNNDWAVQSIGTTPTGQSDYSINKYPVLQPIRRSSETIIPHSHKPATKWEPKITKREPAGKPLSSKTLGFEEN